MKFYFILIFSITINLTAFAERPSWTANELIKEAKRSGYFIALAENKQEITRSTRNLIINFSKGKSFRKNAKELRSFNAGIFKILKVYFGSPKELGSTAYVYTKDRRLYYDVQADPSSKDLIHFPPLLLQSTWLLILVPRSEGGYTIMEDIGAFELVPEILPNQKGLPYITQAQIEAALK